MTFELGGYLAPENTAYQAAATDTQSIYTAAATDGANVQDTSIFNNLSYESFESKTEGVFTYADQSQVGTDETTAQERLNAANEFLKSHQNADGTINDDVYASMSALTCIMDENTKAMTSQLIDSDGDGFYDSIEYYNIDGNGTRQFDESGDGLMDTQTEFEKTDEGNTVKTTYALDENGEKGDVIEKTVKDSDGYLIEELVDSDDDGKKDAKESYEYIYDSNGNVIKVKVKIQDSDGGKEKIEYRSPDEVKGYIAN